MAYLPTGKGDYTNPPIAFAPDSFDGLVVWYDSNSAVKSNGNLLSWSDKTLYSNTIIPGTTRNVSNYNFSNSYYTNQHTLEFKYPNSGSAAVGAGATIFTVWKPFAALATTSNLSQNLVSVFVDNMANPGDFGSNFSVGITGGSTLSNFSIFTSDLSVLSGSTYKTLTFSSYTSQSQIINAICFNSNYLGTGYSRGYLNGACVSSNTVPITLTNNQKFFNVFIGDSNYFNSVTSNHGGASYIYETLVYNTVLSPAQISQVNKYLQAKNGTAALANGGNFTY